MAQVKKGLAYAFAATLSLVAAFEGYSNYPVIPVPGDPPTACRGFANAENRYYSDDECDQITAAQINKTLAAISKDIPGLPPEILGAAGDMCFNTGMTECRQATFYSHLRAHRYRQACEAMATKRFDEDGLCHGYGCGWAHGRMYKGLQKRRQAERELCLKGVK